MTLVNVLIAGLIAVVAWFIMVYGLEVPYPWPWVVSLVIFVLGAVYGAKLGFPTPRD